MAATIDIPAGGYSYIPYAFQYSGGVLALEGFRIERVEFADPLPLATGFAWIERFLGEQGVPLTALLRLRTAFARSSSPIQASSNSIVTTPALCCDGA